ncbi:MAG: ACP S-malonyltransferase [Spirochaetes bacterium]|nr:ACP S-malonyltransferase [Spirochaetota bacterium]
MAEQTVFMFPGQGSQYPGMRGPLGGMYGAAGGIFARADEVLGFPLSVLMDEGPEEELTRTSNAQLALLVMGTAYREAALSRGHAPDIVMGHSLGEYAAMVAAGVISFEDALKIVRRRGELMERAAEETPGGMAAVIGASQEVLEGVVARCADAGVLEITNFNSPTQMVLSGESAAVDRAVELIGEERLGRAMRLNVSAPFHSSLMGPVACEFEAFIASFAFKRPEITFIDNVTGMTEDEPERIRQKLVLQITSPVLWVQSVRHAHDLGGRVFVECGPGSVLAGLVKRILSGVSIIVGEKMIAS